MAQTGAPSPSKTATTARQSLATHSSTEEYTRDSSVILGPFPSQQPRTGRRATGQEQDLLEGLTSGDAICFIGGVHKGKQGVYLQRTEKSVCVKIHGLDKERSIMPENVWPPGHPDTFVREIRNHTPYQSGDLLDIVGGTYRGRLAKFLEYTPKRVRVMVDGFPYPKCLAPSSVRRAR